MTQSTKSSRIDSEVALALNEHVSLEAKSAFAYFAMASWAQVKGLSGFASWFRSEAEGELEHTRLFVDHLNDRGFQATFGNLPAPASEWSSIQAVFEQVTELEHALCDRIQALFELSHERRDHFTGSFLQGFVPQQIADMAEADEILDRLRIVGKDGQGVILIDQELRAKSNA